MEVHSGIKPFAVTTYMQISLLSIYSVAIKLRNSDVSETVCASVIKAENKER